MIARYTVIVAATSGESCLVVVNEQNATLAARRACEIATGAASIRPRPPKKPGRERAKPAPIIWWAAAVLGTGGVDLLADVEGHHGTIHRDPIATRENDAP
jgi:hypothetical protein